jgi:glyoxylase-like metal-dependent hydrolase (beta-lactamase superfamily II)
MILMGKILGNLFRVLGAGRTGHWFRHMVRPYDYQEVTPALPTRTFEGTLDLQIGGRDVHLIEVGPAHTKGDILVHVPDSRALFCSDMVFFGSTPVMWAGPIENIFSALNRILEMDVDTIIPGHGPIIDQNGVNIVLGYWEFVHKEARRRYDDGMSAATAAHDIVLSSEFRAQPFSDWNSPERMMTNVHMLYRQYKGKTSSAKIPELLNIMRRQAGLAHQLPDAEPALLRKL